MKIITALLIGLISFQPVFAETLAEAVVRVRQQDPDLVFSVSATTEALNRELVMVGSVTNQVSRGPTIVAREQALQSNIVASASTILTSRTPEQIWGLVVTLPESRFTQRLVTVARAGTPAEQAAAGLTILEIEALRSELARLVDRTNVGIDDPRFAQPQEDIVAPQYQRWPQVHLQKDRVTRAEVKTTLDSLNP